MEAIEIEATERSPYIHFDFENNRYIVKGESYPEDVSSFYGDIIGHFDDHIESLKETQVEFTFELIYFNSSSAKILMRLFDHLDECAEAGNKVLIKWIHDADDDNLMELGEEFGEDLEHAEFNLIAVHSA